MTGREGTAQVNLFQKKVWTVGVKIDRKTPALADRLLGVEASRAEEA